MTVQDQFHFITRDFHSVWESIGKQPLSIADGRCNFLLANHAMVFLEWCVRTSGQNEATHTGVSVRFREALFKRTAYGVTLPFPKFTGTLFRMPFFHGIEDSLCAVVFDAIRNGIAHTYYPKTLPIVHVGGSANFVISMTGIEPQAADADSTTCPHLSRYEHEGNVGLWFHPGVAFTDVERAALAVGIDTLPEQARFEQNAVARADLLAALSVLSKSPSPSSASGDP